MVTMSASMNAGDVARFNAALTQYAKVLGKETATAPRRAAIQLCKSFRAGTRQSPKFARSSEYTVTKSQTKPKWVTNKNGVALRRWFLNRMARGNAYDVFEEKKSNVRKNRLLLFHRGLAKQSWGWVMHNIFNGAAPDAPWHRRKRDRRNPKDTVKDSTSTSRTGAITTTGYARICNRLDYIGDALKISIDDAVAKAANWMLKQVERKRPKI